jgi:surface antigen
MSIREKKLGLNFFGIFRFLMIVFYMFLLAFPLNAVDWYDFPDFEEEGIEIGGEYVFIMDSFNGVDAYLNSKSNGSYGIDASYYQCTELVARYLHSIYSTDYTDVKNISNNDTQGFSGYDFHPNYTGNPPHPCVDKGTQTIYLESVTSPIPGDIVVFNNPDHVAIVKTVNGTQITLIEQNWILNNKYTIDRSKNTSDSNIYFYRYPAPLWDVQIKSAWYYNSVHCLYDLGIISGDTDGSFGPDKTISRAEFIKMVVLALEKVLGRDLFNYCAVLLNTWQVEPEYYDYISDAYLFKNNNISPSERIAFWDPNMAVDFSQGVTREEAAHIVRNALELTTSSIGSYELIDVQVCYYAPWVYDVWKISIIDGYDDKTYKPFQVLNRSEAAKMIRNILKYKGYLNNNCNVCPEICNKD